MSGERLWSPSEMRVAKSEITRFMSYLTKRSVNEISDYEALWSYSVSDISGFWRHMLDFTGIILKVQLILFWWMRIKCRVRYSSLGFGLIMLRTR